MIQNENGLLTVVTFDAADSWERLLEVGTGYLNRPGLGKLKALLSGSVVCVALEKHYIDRDYRDTFSGFHSKKFVTPSARTLRLHFFTKAFAIDELRTGIVPSENYVGYSIIRPTRPYCIGRTLLDPKRIKGLVGTVCRCQEKVSIQGTEFTVEGFPFISQDGDATVCAESATWMIQRYFSNRYRSYRELHPFEITSATQHYAQGERVYPSHGLYLWQMAETLRREGFSPVIYTRNGYQGDFEDLMYTYIESGFPVFAVLGDHVVVALGHHSDYSRVLPTGCRAKTSTFNRGFVVNDDNRFPYQLIDTLPPGTQKRNPLVSDHLVSGISAFAVPLPEKVFLRAEEFDSKIGTLLDDHLLGVQALSPILLGQPTLLLRQYLTTCKSFKQHLRGRGMGSVLARDVYHELPMPHFIWVCELSAPGLYLPNGQRILGEILWDATRNAHEPTGVLAVHYPEVLWVDQGSALNGPTDLQGWKLTGSTPYSVLKSNLIEL